MTDLYEILGVDREATKDDIKKAYRAKSMKLHPDRGGDTNEFAVLEEAYRILSDDKAREQYDLLGTTEKELPPIEKLAREQICQLFVSTIEISIQKKEDINYVDIIGRIRATIEKEIEVHIGNLEIGDSRVSKLEAILDRIHTVNPDDENILRQALVARIEGFNATRGPVEEAIKLCEATLEALKEHEYDFSEKPPERSATVRIKHTPWPMS